MQRKAYKMLLPRRKKTNGASVCVKKYEVKVSAFTFDFEPFEVSLTNGYYSVEYTIEER